MLGPQSSLDGSGLAGDAAAPGTLERRADLADGQLRHRGRGGGFDQQLQGVGGVQVLERLQGGGEVLAQGVPQPLGVAGAFLDQRLVHPGDDLDRLSLRAIAGDGPQLVGVGADHVGQHRVIPATPSGSFALASTRPATSISSTLWWPSTQSSPINSRNRSSESM
jgi:hypothetical protein